MVQNANSNQIEEFNDSIVYNIGRLYLLLGQYLSKIYQEFKLNPAKFNLLMHIKHKGKDKGISQIELGEEMYVSAPNITKLIDGLEKKGWVQRVSSKKDRRVKLIKITPNGSDLLDRAWIEHVKALNNILRDFSPGEKAQFNGFLERFIRERK